MVARPDGEGSRWTAVNACLVPALALDGQEVVTAEGLGTPDDLHPVQREMADRGGSQCGYCTPGFVCSMAAEYYRPGRDEFDLHAIAGNLCRCTGYRPIRDAAEALGAPPADDPLAARRGRGGAGAGGDPGRRVRPARRPRRGVRRCCASTRTATVLAGGTDWGVEVNIRGERAAYVVAVDRLPELRGFAIDDHSVEIGAALTLSEVETALDGRLPLLDEVFPLFASRLIRNGATIGGNLGTASPIGDLAPALLALEAGVVLVSADGDREVPLADYFTGYRETVRRADELIRAVRVPLPTRRDHRVPQDRQAALRRHLQRGGRVRDRRRRRRREVGADRARRGRRDPDPGAGHRGGARGSALGRADGARGGRGAARRGHPDGRPPGQRGVPLGDARATRC